MTRRIGMIIFIISILLAIIFGIDLIVFEIQNYGITDLQIIKTKPMSVIGMSSSIILMYFGVYLHKNAS